ncbi:Protein of unknown function, partial [Cotesia congregata]
MQRLNCSLCNQSVPGALNGLSRHLVKDHVLSINRGMGDSGFQCGQNGCRRRFRFFYSLRRHIEKKHLNNVDDNDEAGNEDIEVDNNIREQQFGDLEVNYEAVHDEENEQDSDGESVAGDVDNNDMDFDLKKYVIRMIARFQCKPSMTSSLLTEVVDECEQLLVNTCNFLKHKVERFFDVQELLDDNEAQNVLKAFEFDGPFDGLKTSEQQIDTLKQYFSYIEPIEIPLGYRPDSVLDRKTSTYKPKMVMETCQYVPIISTLTLVIAKWGGKDVKLNRMMTTNGRTVFVEDTASKEALYDFDYIDTDRVFRCNSAKVNGVEFRVGLYVCLEASHLRDDNLPSFGCIKEIIILRNTDVYLFISKYTTTEFDEAVNAYHITHNDNDADEIFIKTSILAHFKPICCWTKQSSDNLYINEDIDGAAFLQLTNQDLSQLKIKMGPKKKLLALIDSLNQEKITGSYIIDSSGVLEKQTQNETVCSTPPINVSLSRASTSGVTSSLSSPKLTPTSCTLSTSVVSSNTFSRYGTVENTLKEHQQGKEILSAIRGTCSEGDRKCFVRILVGELVKTHNDTTLQKKQKSLWPKRSLKNSQNLKIRSNLMATRSWINEHYFNPKSGNDRGFIENRLLTIRKLLSPTKKKYA